MINKNSYNIDVIKKEPTNVDYFMILLILNINNNIDMFCLYLCSTSKAELLCMLAVADKSGDG